MIQFDLEGGGKLDLNPQAIKAIEAQKKGVYVIYELGEERLHDLVLENYSEATDRWKKHRADIVSVELSNGNLFSFLPEMVYAIRDLTENPHGARMKVTLRFDTGSLFNIFTLQTREIFNSPETPE